MPVALSPPVTDPSNAPAKLASEQQELLKQLDECVDRMRTHISDEPYITTIPQDEPKFHHYSRHDADIWLTDTPFDRNENYQVQYQSFFYREPYSDIYERVRYSHFDRSSQPSRAAPARPQQQMSATNTPSVGPKKKISLAAYKNKQAQGTLATPSDGHHENKASKMPRPGLSGEKEKALAEVKVELEEGEEDAQDLPYAQGNSPAASANGAHVGNELKRKQLSGDMSASPKKQRLSPPMPRKDSSSTSPKSLAVKQSKMSPTLPPARLSPLRSLPGRLSPTLPPQLIAALDGGHRRRHTSDSSTESSAQPKVMAQRPGSKHDSVLSHANELGAEHSMTKGSQTGGKKVPAGAKASLVIVLKIPKKHRSSFRRLVQFSGRTAKERNTDHPTATKSTHASHPSTSRDDHNTVSKADKPHADDGGAAKGVVSKSSVSKPAPKTNPSASTSAPGLVSASKRPRPSEEEESLPQAKRKKPPPVLKVDKAPSTPLEPAFRSPALPHSAFKPQQATPTRKDIRTTTATAMKRVESSDSINHTPAGPDRTPASRTGAVPTSNQQHSSSNLRPSPSSSAARTPESQAWSAEFTRLSRMAKELKHAAPEPPSGGESSAKMQRLAETAALASVETFLAFVLAFSCNDKSYSSRNPPQLSDPQNWISCHGFWRMVKSRCQPFPHLCGLTAYLGAVYNGVIMRRLTNSGSAKPDLKVLQDSVAAALRAADEAALKLPPSAIQTAFPLTWKRGMAPPPKTGDGHTASPGHYAGHFSLHLGIHTDPLEAVRFAHSILTEWLAKKDLDYKMRLKLSA